MLVFLLIKIFCNSWYSPKHFGNQGNKCDHKSVILLARSSNLHSLKHLHQMYILSLLDYKIQDEAVIIISKNKSENDFLTPCTMRQHGG